MAEDDVKVKLAIELEDDVSEPTGQAAQALAELRDKITEDNAAISQMQKAMRELKVAGKGNTAEFVALKGAIDRKRGAVAQANAAYLQLGGTFRKVKASGLAHELQELSKSASALPGPLGGIVSSVARFVAGLSTAKLVLIGVVGGIAALLAISAKAVTSLYSYATAQAEARRSELLRLEGLTKIRTLFSVAFGLGTDNAKELQSTIDRVSASTSIGRDKTVEYTRQLETMGVRGKNVGIILQAMATKSMVQGEAQAQLFAGWAARTALMGGNVQKLADRVQSQIGGTARKMMLSADVQAQKLQESFAALTHGIDTEPLDKARADFNELFSQSTASGRALKQLLGSIVQPLVDSVTKAQPILKHFVQDMIIFALRVEIAWLKLRVAFAQVIKKGSIDNLREKFDGLGGSIVGVCASIAAAFAVTLIPALLGAIAEFAILGATALVAGASMLAAGIVAAAPFLLIGAAIFGVIKIVELLYTVWKEIDWSDALKGATSWLSDASTALVEGGKAMAKALWDGFIGGITAFGAKALEGVSIMAKNIVGAFRTAIDAHSPSRVFAELGATIPAGVKVGIEQGSPGATAAAAKLVEVPKPAPVRSASEIQRAQQSSSATRGGTITIAQLTVQASSDKPQQLALDIKHELERVLESVAIQMGAEQPA